MELEILKESVLIQLNQMIQHIKNDSEYFKKIVEEPLFYENQCWISKDMEIIRMDLKISKDKIKV